MALFKDRAGKKLAPELKKYRDGDVVSLVSKTYNEINR